MQAAREAKLITLFQYLGVNLEGDLSSTRVIEEDLGTGGRSLVLGTLGGVGERDRERERERERERLGGVGGFGVGFNSGRRGLGFRD